MNNFRVSIYAVAGLSAWGFSGGLKWPIYGAIPAALAVAMIYTVFGVMLKSIADR